MAHFQSYSRKFGLFNTGVVLTKGNQRLLGMFPVTFSDEISHILKHFVYLFGSDRFTVITCFQFTQAQFISNFLTYTFDDLGLSFVVLPVIHCQINLSNS